MPKTMMNEKTVENLQALITSKQILLSHAFATDEIKVVIHDDRISFPWSHIYESAEEVHACSDFIAKLYNLARTLTHTNNTQEKIVENDKYAFRCFLLRLGFIGDEYKNTRKILLKNLSGRSAFKEGKSERSEQ